MFNVKKTMNNIQVLGKIKIHKKAQKMGKLLTSHRSTTYPCYLPVLGESAGAGCIRLTRDKGREILENWSDIFI